MTHQIRFLLVDDDEIANMINDYTIKIKMPDAKIDAFIKPSEALNFIKNELTDDDHTKIILLLDLNMPLMDGWEFLEEFNKVEVGIQHKFVVYILTSSINDSDEAQAKSNPLVTGFLSKPLTEENVATIINTNS